VREDVNLGRHAYFSLSDWLLKREAVNLGMASTSVSVQPVASVARLEEGQQHKLASAKRLQNPHQVKDGTQSSVMYHTGASTTL
jgi:hypothetical protein